MLHTRFKIALCAGVLSTLGLVGCHENSNAPAPSEVPAGSANAATIPPRATKVAQGTGELKYKAEIDGAMYMTDENMKRIVMRKRLRAGQNFEFNTKTGAAKIDGQT